MWQPDTFGILCLALTMEEDILIAPCPQQPEHGIQVLGLHEGTQYLVIYVTCSGDTKPMEQHIWQKAVLYTQAFSAYTYVMMGGRGPVLLVFLPALTYSFPVMGLSSTFIEQIHCLYNP